MSEQECNVWIRNNRIGALIPRTCAECGLGPCRYVEQPPATKASSNPEIERLNQIIDNLNAALRLNAKDRDEKQELWQEALRRLRDEGQRVNVERRRTDEAESKRKESAKDFETAFRVLRQENDRLGQLVSSLERELDALKRDNMREVEEFPASAPSAAPQSDGFELTCSQCGKTFRSKHAHDTMCDNCIQF